MNVINAEATGELIFKKLKERYGRIENAASDLAISPIAVYKWKRGVCLPKIDNLVVIADLLDCSLDELIIRREI